MIILKFYVGLISGVVGVGTPYTRWFAETKANGNDLSRNKYLVDGEKVSKPTIINLFPDPF